MTTAKITELQAYGLEHACDRTFEIPEDFPVGQPIPQGDLNFVRLSEVPAGAEPTTFAAQLAPGTSRGSRHCLCLSSPVEMFAFRDAIPLEGPIWRSTEPVTVTHPEHRDLIFPAGVWAVGFQRRLGLELRRNED